MRSALYFCTDTHAYQLGTWVVVPSPRLLVILGNSYHSLIRYFAEAIEGNTALHPLLGRCSVCVVICSEDFLHSHYTVYSKKLIVPFEIKKRLKRFQKDLMVYLLLLKVSANLVLDYP